MPSVPAARLWAGWCRRSPVRLYATAGGVASNIRNVAIIAHVDHGNAAQDASADCRAGKTTLVDCLLRQSGAIEGSAGGSRVMDSNELEKERGITILAKCTSIDRAGYRINIVDTPGHADFGGEVERALTMVDGVILVVDATEGPMAQTKFVLTKALKRNLVPIVVQNKVDRDTARCDDVDCELLDLFMSLNATDLQLNYSTVYASARDGWALPHNPFSVQHQDKERISGDMSCLFDLIANKIPAPCVLHDRPFSLLVNSVEPNAFVGKCLLGKIQSGAVALGDRIRSISPEGLVAEENRVTRMFVRRGLQQVCPPLLPWPPLTRMQIDITKAHAGEIVSLAGIQMATVNFTIASPEVSAPLEVRHARACHPAHCRSSPLTRPPSP